MATLRQSPALCGDLTPPYSNTGGKIRETPTYREESHSQAAFTDWIACTFPMREDAASIKDLSEYLGVAFGKQFGTFIERNHGFMGWKRSFDIGDTSAKFAIGGQNRRGYLGFDGDACNLISRESWHPFIYLMTEVYQGKITRWDGAYDDFKGIHCVDWALNQYDNGGFNTKGRKPKVGQSGDWHTGKDKDGRTLYIGRRQNGRFLRVYEKGKQLGNPESKWNRWEAELKAKDLFIPFDVLLHPGKYVAGAYPCMSWIHGETSRIKTHKEKEKIELEAIIRACKNSYGKLIYTLNKEHGANQTIRMLGRRGTPDRLKSPAPPD